MVVVTDGFSEANDAIDESNCIVYVDLFDERMFLDYQ